MTNDQRTRSCPFVISCFSFDIPSSLVGHSTEFVISPSGAQLAPSYPVTRPRTGRAGISPDRGDLGTVPRAASVRGEVMKQFVRIGTALACGLVVVGAVV